MLELRTAKAWGLSPRGWRQEPVDDRAMMMAFELFTNTRDAYREEWKEEQRERAKSGKAKKGMNPYEAMKKSMGIE